MGMFDTITVHNKFLPLLKEMGELGYEYDSFQTKDLENSLLEYFVDEDGVLRKTVYTYELSIIFQKISFDIRRKIDKLHPLYSKNYEQEK